MSKSLVHAFLFALPLASAMPWEGPAPTPTTTPPPAVVNDLDDMGWSHVMASAPAALFAAYELKKRQTQTTSSSRSTVTEYHATCGFLTGDPGNPLTCVNTGYQCAIDTSRGVFGCCTDLASCGVRTTCIPQAQLSSCDGACQTDSFIQKCNPTYPFCNQHLLIQATNMPTLTNWYCSDYPTIEPYFATATSGTLQGQYVSVTLPISSKSSSKSSSSSSRTTTSSSSTTSGSVVSIITVTPTPTPTPTPAPEKKAPIGAIVGGVVGGVALIIAAIVAFICFKRKNKKDPHTPPAPVEVPVGHPGPGYGPVPGNSVDPNAHGFYQPAIAEKEAPVTTQQPRAEMYSPPSSPAPQYTPTYGQGGGQQKHVSQNIYPNVAEMGPSEMSAHAGPGTY